MYNKGITKQLSICNKTLNIIIYGAGAYGKLTYDFLKRFKNVNIVKWVDKNYNKIIQKEYELQISSPEVIKKINFDFIILAVTTEKFINEICKFIKFSGIKEEKIILIDENEFEQKKKIKFFEDKNFEVKLSDYNDYVYIRDKYSSYVDLRKQKSGKDSGIIWLLWFQGWDNAPAIVIKCSNSVKKYGRGRQIVYLDEKNYTNYVDIPEDIRIMYKDGIISDAHFSDILRLELLKKYGGLWLDATVLLTDELEDFITEGSLFIYRFPIIQCTRLQAGAVSISNWLIYSCSNNVIIEETLRLLYIYWREEKQAINYFIMHFIFRIVTNIYNDEWEKVPYFPNSNCFIMEKELNNPYNENRMKQILGLSKLHKLTYKLNISTENSMYEYILKNI
ncbi:MAG: hypothetical protein HFH68_08500 [Lachnospiraceae bacterium]|nr:hypothetical protein [Lachnospiraceae bacterium]